GGPSSKHEQRTADGVTSGGYSYVDANGLVQSLAYVSDPVNGFRVSGTNLPADSNTAHHAALPVVHQAAVPSPYYLAAAAPAPL
ncbi:chitin-binding domain-containing protein, partial [Staphylococcus aureus]|nr:chitin-binding domain-containing protein [Staphylococcus aureus]